MPEGIGDGDMRGLIVAVSREDALAVFVVLVALLVVAVRGGVLIADGEGLGELARGICLAEQEAIGSAAARFAREITEKNALDALVHGNGDGRAHHEDEHDVFVDLAHFLDEL